MQHPDISRMKLGDKNMKKKKKNILSFLLLHFSITVVPLQMLAVSRALRQQREREAKGRGKAL